MKSVRSASEDRFRNLLIRAGIAEAQIKEPGLEPEVIGTADFLVGDVAFEVKEIVPNKEEKKQIEQLRQNINDKKVEAFYVPDKTVQFKTDIQDARKKFKKYPNYATVLVEDLTEWWWNEPDIERMMFGSEALHINSENGDLLGVTWKNRVLRLDRNRSIGSYIIITTSNILIYHNLMAEECRSVFD